MSKKLNATLRITQIRSSIDYRQRARKTLEALGIKRMHHTVEQPDNPAIRGMIKAIEHLLKVEEVKE
ncbi:50S ribosomal protein L30 [bacterium]|nr:50S ribosomal protein L30 [bacterium]MBU1063310.1 50S ribosomal protein L30 [bacterium]MBU1634785.1 50S ribosomal protein L30 [bacterium]MBU1874046.1 50S ribosomal protein L30 [bacterium]